MYLEWLNIPLITGYLLYLVAGSAFADKFEHHIVYNDHKIIIRNNFKGTTLVVDNNVQDYSSGFLGLFVMKVLLLGQVEGRELKVRVSGWSLPPKCNVFINPVK